MTRTAHCPTPPSLGLLGGFRLVVDGSDIGLPVHAQRVLAYLAVQSSGPQPGHRRADLAARLWGDVSEERSHASLRTALWRIRRADPRLVRASRATVRLDEQVEVDLHRCVAQATRLADGDGDGDLRPQDAMVQTLRGELLPAWEEDWLLLERERIRQIQIHALEALARRLCACGRRLEAIEAAYAAIAAEPLRESAHAALIEVFLAEGNAAQARRQLARYSALLWDELGLRPSAALTARMDALCKPSPIRIGDR